MFDAWWVLCNGNHATSIYWRFTMRKLRIAASISILALSFGATAALAGVSEMDRCNAGPPLGAEERSAAAEPRNQSVAGVNLGCLDNTDRNYDYSDSRRNSQDRNSYRDGRPYQSSRSNYSE
jgi:hypothetical protein